MKAYFVKEVQRPGLSWDRRLYQVKPQFRYRDWNERTTMLIKVTDYLLVSATTGEREKETIVLPADENGTPLDTNPLPGSLKGDRNHEAALRQAGYTICIADKEVDESVIPTQIEDYDGAYADLAEWEETTVYLTTDDDTTFVVHGVTHPKFGVMVWDKTRAAEKASFLKAMRARKAELGLAPASPPDTMVLCTTTLAISTDGDDPITPYDGDEAEDLTIYHKPRST